MTTASNDPRFRPFRGVAWVLYLILAVGVSVLVIVSVYRSVLQMTPERPTGVTAVLPEDQCLREAQALFDTLDAQRKGLTEGEVRSADARFLSFRVEWLKRKRLLEAQCQLEVRPKLRGVYGTLDRVLDLYTTGSVQFSGAVGPSVDEFRKQLSEAGR